MITLNIAYKGPSSVPASMYLRQKKCCYTKKYINTLIIQFTELTEHGKLVHTLKIMCQIYG